MESIQNKYIGLNERLTMILTKNNCSLSVEEMDDEKSNYSFFGINETGKSIVENIIGTETLLQFQTRFCKQFDIDYEENIGWIQEFLLTLNERNVIEFKNIPKKCSIWKVIGNGENISPMHVTVELTDKCNLACKHCYLDASVKNKNFITIEQFRSLVNKFKERGVMNIELTGGELFLNPDSYEIIKLSLEKFASVGILTNGTILDDDIIELLKEYKNQVIVSISIDSVDGDKHDSFRGVKRSFEKSCNSIKRLSEAGVAVRMSSSIFYDNMWEIDKLAELALKLGARAFSYNFIENFGRGKDFDNVKKGSYGKAEDYVRYIQNTLNKYKDIIPLVDSENYVDGFKNCGAGNVSVVIGSNGNIRPCALTPKEVSLGNVFAEDYDEIFKKDIFKRIASIKPPNLNNGCSKLCRDYSVCKGCCLKALNINLDRSEPCSWITHNNLHDMLNWYVGVVK